MILYLWPVCSLTSSSFLSIQLLYSRNTNEKLCIIAECHRLVTFITEPRSGEVINLIGRWHEANYYTMIHSFHFYFYSNNDPTSSKGPRKQTTESILGTALLEKKTVTNGWMGKQDLAYCQLNLSGNNAEFVSVDLIGEKNQVILEYF